jgi:hypothetical protein
MLSSIWLSSVSDIFPNIWFVAAIWMGLALVASLVSIWTGISVALIEILVGVLAGNFLHLHVSNEWINFLALLGSGDRDARNGDEPRGIGSRGRRVSLARRIVRALGGAANDDSR